MRDVDLIRHAYVLPAKQRQGIGSQLLQHLRQVSTRRLLVGTWAAAEWAIRFYERHGFALVSPARKTVLLTTYWNIPERQIETSVVLVHPPDICGPLKSKATARGTRPNHILIGSITESERNARFG